jgi:CheY-like chemotaxis protein
VHTVAERKAKNDLHHRERILRLDDEWQVDERPYNKGFVPQSSFTGREAIFQRQIRVHPRQNCFFLQYTRPIRGPRRRSATDACGTLIPPSDPRSSAPKLFSASIPSPLTSLFRKLNASKTHLRYLLLSALIVAEHFDVSRVVPGKRKTMGSQSDAASIVSSGSPGREISTVLVVDDSPLDREIIGRLLGSLEDVSVSYARDGAEGLAAIKRVCPRVILTDLVLPDMQGTELIREVRAEHPHISMILVTAYGSEEVAMQALRAGAANYIPKRDLARDLVSTLRQVLTIAAITHERKRISRSLVRRESEYVLDSDPELIMPFLKLMQEEIDGMGLCDPTGQLQVGVALQEALCNSLFHGNLEVMSDLRQDDEDEFYQVAAQRRTQEPYRSRRIRLRVQLDRSAARFIIADDGPGFDTSIVDRPVRAEDLSRIGGRGLLLIRTFMDHVSFNETGSQITLVKNRSS